MNYYIWVIPLEESDLLLIDEMIRKILIKHKIHLQPSNKERLYLPRKELGRGLCKMVHKSEKMSLQLFNTLNESKNTSLRWAAILNVMIEENKSTALISEYLKIKYNIEDELTISSRKKLKSKIYIAR